MTAIAVMLAWTAFVLPAGIGSFARDEDMIAVTATFGTILLVAALVLVWAVVSALRQDWNAAFEPSCYFTIDVPERTEERESEIAELCVRKRVPCRITQKYARDTGRQLRLGFIDEEDLMLIRLSI